MAKHQHLTMEFVDQQIHHWQNVRQILLRIEEHPTDSIETRIYKRYLKLGNVATVAKELNEEGFRLLNETTGKQLKFTSNDVSDFIRSKKIDDEEMMQLTRTILKDHTAFANKHWN